MAKKPSKPLQYKQIWNNPTGTNYLPQGDYLDSMEHNFLQDYNAYREITFEELETYVERHVFRVYTNIEISLFHLCYFYSNYIKKFKTRKSWIYIITDGSDADNTTFCFIHKYRILYSKLTLTTNVKLRYMKKFTFGFITREGRITSVQALNRADAIESVCELENLDDVSLFQALDWICDEGEKILHVVKNGKIEESKKINNFDPKKIIPQELKMTRQLKKELSEDFDLDGDIENDKL